ncbi:hypothetical protein WEI85_36455 [Actinomycetes bacterium KLBMP 9797]
MSEGATDMRIDDDNTRVPGGGFGADYDPEQDTGAQPEEMDKNYRESHGRLYGEPVDDGIDAHRPGTEDDERVEPEPDFSRRDDGGSAF